ncbi:MAG: hypothetical protein AAF682_12115 [Planctomycetota bacterium]
MSPLHESRLLHFLFVFWLVLLAAGFSYVVDYEFQPAELREPPPDLPAEYPRAADEELHLLLLFAHPKCPCTRATVEELNRLMTACVERVEARVHFFRPRDAADGWEHTDLFRAAESIPGVTALVDPGGEIAQRFGASTSGEVYLYSPAGELRFRGGITASRGHAGDNVGRHTIVELVRGGVAERDETPVFGCRLLDDCGGA